MAHGAPSAILRVTGASRASCSTLKSPAWARRTLAVDSSRTSSMTLLLFVVMRVPPRRAHMRRTRTCSRSRLIEGSRIAGRITISRFSDHRLRPDTALSRGSQMSGRAVYRTVQVVHSPYPRAHPAPDP